MDTANILIVDDHPENLLAIEAILEGLEANLIRAHSGEEALKALLNQDFAVILLDVQMAGMDGFETAAMIKQREKSRLTPIIFITAINRSEHHIFKGYDLGAVDYLFKPIVPEVLKAKVSVFVDLFKKTREIQTQAVQIDAINKQLQAQLDEVWRLNQETSTLNHELESFSYSVSHDLRAPLRSINSFSQALLQDHFEEVSDQGKYYLERIQVGCKRMTELVDALLQLSRLSQEKIQPVAVNLSAMATEILNELCQINPERRVKIEVQPHQMVMGDHRLLRLLLENLINNAWKFTRNKEETLIEFGSFRQQNQERDGLVYFVRDNGAGFDMEFSDQLFLPFQRLHLESEFEGTGIGLATVQRIVRRHHGQIWAEGYVDEGATFYFTLQS